MRSKWRGRGKWCKRSAPRNQRERPRQHLRVMHRAAPSFRQLGRSYIVSCRIIDRLRSGARVVGPEGTGERKENVRRRDGPTDAGSSFRLPKPVSARYRTPQIIGTMDAPEWTAGGATTPRKARNTSGTSGASGVCGASGATALARWFGPLKDAST